MAGDHRNQHIIRFIQATITILAVIVLSLLVQSEIPKESSGHDITIADFATSTVRLFASSTPAEALAGTAYLVTHVVDGDTIDIAVATTTVRIRLIGINTPESVDPRRPVECFGKEASGFLKAFLDGRSVYVASDPSQDNHDKYGRLLRYLFRDDGLPVNAVLVAMGYAQEYTYRTPHLFQSEFRTLQAQAQAEGAGLWSAETCSGAK